MGNSTAPEVTYFKEKPNIPAYPGYYWARGYQGWYMKYRKTEPVPPLPECRATGIGFGFDD